jgi:hypothetical protein
VGVNINPIHHDQKRCEGRKGISKALVARHRIESSGGRSPGTGSAGVPGLNKASMLGKGLAGKVTGVK